MKITEEITRYMRENEGTQNSHGTPGNSSIAITNPSDASSVGYRNAASSSFAFVLISHQFQMTPLPRWVLLALLLVLAGAHPDDHACVRLCRAQTGSPEIAEVCDHRQNDVLQSFGEGRYLFRLCLTPCSDPGSPGHPFYDGSSDCRSFRDELIERHACSCDGEPGNLKEDQGFEDVQLRESKLSDMPRKMGEGVSVNSGDVENADGWSRDLPEDEMEVSIAEDWLTAMDADVEDETDSTEDSIDWERWCMTQCDNGQGGSACNCDIIP